MFKKSGRKTIVFVSVVLILALFIGACGSPAPAAVSSSPVQQSESAVAIYWDEESQQILDQIIAQFQSENQHSGMTPEELRTYYLVHNPINFVEMSAEQRSALIAAGGLVLVGGTATGTATLTSGGTVVFVDAGSPAFPLLTSMLPALEISPLVMVFLGSGVALKYTTTQAYADKMALMQTPLPQYTKVFVPTFSSVSLTTFSGMQLYLPPETYTSVVTLENVLGQNLTTSQLSSSADITWLAANIQKTITVGVATLTINISNCHVDLNLDFKGEKFNVSEEENGNCDPVAQMFYAVAKLIEKFATRIAVIVTSKPFVDALAKQDVAAMQFKLDAQEVISGLQVIVSTLLKEMIAGGYFN